MSLDMFPDAAIDYLKDVGPKPRIVGEVDVTEVATFGGKVIRTFRSTRWVVSCPCHCSGAYAIAAVPSWEAAVEIALIHGERFHR